MARITITEIDNSWYNPDNGSEAFVVYAPGITTFGPEEPTLVTANSFDKLFGSYVTSATNKPVEIVKSYLKEGAVVLFQRLVPPGAAKASATKSKLDITVTAKDPEDLTNVLNENTIGTITYERQTGSWPIAYIDAESQARREALGGVLLTNIADITGSAAGSIADGAQIQVTVGIVGTDTEGSPIYGVISTINNFNTTITFRAKYTGTKGNDLTIKVLKIEESEPGVLSGSLTVSIPMQNSVTNELVEVLNVRDFIRGDYDSDYIDIICDGYTITNGKILVPSISGETFKLTGGKDFAKEYKTVNNFDYTTDAPTATFGTHFLECTVTDSESSTTTTWKEDGTVISLSAYGLAVKSDYTPANGDTVVVGIYKDATGSKKAMVISGLSEVTTAVAISKGVLGNVKDSLLYDFDIATSCGLEARNGYVNNEGAIVSLDNVLADVVEERGDAIYVVDGIETETYEQYYAYAKQFNTSFCTAIGPTVVAQSSITGTTSRYPGSYPFIISWARSVNSGSPIWYAPAGVKRATLSNVLSTTEPVGKLVLDLWQNNHDIGQAPHHINPIIRLKNYGYVVYGDSTLLHDKVTGEFSALQQLSTRVLVNNIRKKAFDISLGLQFDQMTNAMLVEYRTLLSTYLDTLKYQSGIYDYQILIGLSDTLTSTMLNTKTVPVIIRISPNPAVENFDITLEVTQAGVSFTEE